MWLIKNRLSVVERLIGIESVTKADSLGREDSSTGTLSFSVSVAEAFLVKAQHSPLQSSQMNQTQTSPSPSAQKSTLLPW